MILLIEFDLRLYSKFESSRKRYRDYYPKLNTFQQKKELAHY